MFGRDHEQLAAASADVTGLQARLARDITGLQDGGDLACRQALADAAERYNTAADLVAGAGTVGELLVARGISIDGLAMVRIVRERQGLPLGADLPRQADLTGAGSGGTGPPLLRTTGPESSDPARGRIPFWKKALAIGGAFVAADLVGDMVGNQLAGDADRYPNQSDGWSSGSDW